jgi:membrane-bound acyltransferase YfiQ involved in biofilm formation
MAPDDTPDQSKQEARRDEDEAERLDRELIELLNELRVVMPGVQVLFGFLLAVPFQQRFEDVNAFQRDVYFVTLLAAMAATAFLIAPSAYHRIAFGQHEKPNIILVGTVQFVCGLVALAIAMNGAVLLVTDFLFHAGTVIVTLLVTGSLFAWLWFGIGVWRRMRR